MRDIRFREVDTAFKHKKALFNQDHWMVFYNTRVLSNQDQEQFHRVLIPCSTKTKPCSIKTKIYAETAFSDSVFNQDKIMWFADKTKSESVVFRFRVFREQFEQDRVS